MTFFSTPSTATGNAPPTVCAVEREAANCVPRLYPADLDALFVSMPAAQPDQPRAAAMQVALFPEMV